MSVLFTEPGHFYSPIPTPDEAEFAIFRFNQGHAKPIAGIEIDLDAMEQLWEEFESSILKAPFPKTQNDNFRFYFDNSFFSYGDALVYFSILDKFKPRNIIEIGSGFSSALLLDAVDILHLDLTPTFIEPYPTMLLEVMRPDDHKHAEVIVSKIQGVDLAVFDQLKAGDILFVDSSHVVKSGSDLTVIIFDILPRLSPGVIIHFHDIFAGFEYPKAWVMSENRGWNECYFLKSFLMYNTEFEIIFFNSHFALAKHDLVVNSQSDFKLNVGGSLWLRKKKSST